MNLIKFFFTKTFLINCVIAILLVFITMYFLFDYMNDYTYHGESLTVPELKGMQMDEIDEFLQNKQLLHIILDSTYVAGFKPHIVVDQDPPANTKVKQYRTIYLTISTQNPPMVKMPDLIDISYRQAKSILESKRLKLGELIYRPDLAKNVVLKQQVKNKDIKPDTKIPKGTVVNLYLGNGLGTEKVNVPNLIGLTKGQATELLHEYFLNVGAVVYAGNITDTASANIFKQIPPYDENKLLNQGATVDVFLKQ